MIADAQPHFRDIFRYALCSTSVRWSHQTQSTAVMFGGIPGCWASERPGDVLCVRSGCCQRGVARAPAIRSQTPESSLMTNKHRKVALKPTLGRQDEFTHHCDESKLSTVISRCLERLVKGVIFRKGQGNLRRTARMAAKMAQASSRNYVEGRSGALKPCGRGIRQSPATERWPGWKTVCARGYQRLATHGTARMRI